MPRSTPTKYRNGKRTKKITDTLTPQLDLTYFTPNVSYVFLSAPWLEISLPFEAGPGPQPLHRNRPERQNQSIAGACLCPSSWALAVLVKPFRWVGVSGSVGYRKSVFRN